MEMCLNPILCQSNGELPHNHRNHQQQRCCRALVPRTPFIEHPITDRRLSEIEVQEDPIPGEFSFSGMAER